MPRTPLNYDNVTFYKIVCKDLDIKDCYVGHTTHLTNRKNKHKTVCNDPNNKSYNITVYAFIRSEGGWDNWDVIPIDRCKCEDRLDVLKKERSYIETLNAKLNQNIPSRTMQEYSKQYREIHQTKIRQQMKEYSEKNKDKKTRI